MPTAKKPTPATSNGSHSPRRHPDDAAKAPHPSRATDVAVTTATHTGAAPPSAYALSGYVMGCAETAIVSHARHTIATRVETRTTERSGRMPSGGVSSRTQSLHAVRHGRSRGR